MTNRTTTDINLQENATIKMNIKGIWWIITSVFLAAVCITTANLNLNYKIERLSIQTTQQHEKVLLKLNEIDLNQRLFVLKNGLEEVMIMSVRHHDQYNNSTNRMSLDEEQEYRQSIRDILNR